MWDWVIFPSAGVIRAINSRVFLWRRSLSVWGVSVSFGRILQRQETPALCGDKSSGITNTSTLVRCSFEFSETSEFIPGALRSSQAEMYFCQQNLKFQLCRERSLVLPGFYLLIYTFQLWYLKALIPQNCCVHKYPRNTACPTSV